jgi:hypothetical protein
LGVRKNQEKVRAFQSSVSLAAPILRPLKPAQEEERKYVDIGKLRERN